MMDDRLRALLVDDEPPARHALSHLLRSLPEVELTGVASNGLEALEALSRTSVELLFLDIEMPSLGGLELATRLRPAVAPAVIFVTAWPQYAVAAFDVAAADYLLKPVDPARLTAAVARARQRLMQSQPWAPLQVPRAQRTTASGSGYVWVEHGASRLRIPLGDIEWFAADGDYVQAHIPERGYLMRGSLNQLEATLPSSRFLRVHRSTLVNIDAVTRVTSVDGHLLLTTHSGATLKVGRRARSRVRQRLEDHA